MSPGLFFARYAGVASAAYRAGYESASPFSREHSRLFGVAPGRDASAMRRLSMGGERLQAI
ncbi:hypothetical protein [Luteibacter sp. CQ10]|uniref:hypothetical protein n=1 Tax=Luteibacter sp. CQ10 TaxID=2805821 RepID=UPI0034A298E1